MIALCCLNIPFVIQFSIFDCVSTSSFTKCFDFPFMLAYLSQRYVSGPNWYCNMCVVGADMCVVGADMCDTAQYNV